jgi:serine phosphatase RsbU (regulator of sigma subunit)
MEPVEMDRDGAGVRVLLVEDDEGDALLVREWLADTNQPLTLSHVRTLADALAWPGRIDCILLDLGLPDAIGLDGVRRLQAAAHRVAIVVLTGHNDIRHGIDAVAAGAQDYLVKGQATGEVIARTIRYAVQRRRAEVAETELLEERLRAQENTRLERGLLPQPIVHDPGLTVTTRYRSGGQRLLLGGDFYDVVEDGTGALHMIIGDVSGHGPDQAALGVALRIAWRTLVLAAHPDHEILPVLSDVLVRERHDDVIFATVCTLTIAPDRRALHLHLAGHPAPLLHHHGRCAGLPQEGSAALGLVPDMVWTPITVTLPDDPWRILLYTDGAIEGRVPGADERLGIAGLADLVDDVVAADPVAAADTGHLLDTLIARVTDLNEGPLTDDLALLCVDRNTPVTPAAQAPPRSDAG